MVSGQLGPRYQYMVKFTILFTQGEAYFFHVGSPSGVFFFQSFFFFFFVFVFFQSFFFPYICKLGRFGSERASERSE